MPAPLTAVRIVTGWYLDPEPVSLTVLAALGYLLGLRRLRRLNLVWPARRVVAWLAGCTALLVATGSGLARYAYVLVSAHMVQHLVVQLIAAPLLVLGAPMTLALRALPATRRSPRRVLLAATRSCVSRWLTHPVVVLAAFASTPFVMYLTGLYEQSLRSHPIHLLVMAHLLIVALLFFTVVIGIDPLPHRPGYPVRLLVLLLAAVAHAVFGVALMQQTQPLAARWWADVARPWWPDPIRDTVTAGGLAWTLGELPTLVIVGVLLRQWIRADERLQRSQDRAADLPGSRSAQDFERYNRMLSDLAHGADGDRAVEQARRRPLR